MTRDWHIGDPIDYSNDGWMDAQNWVPDRVYYIEDDESDLKHKEFIALSDEAWQLYEEGKYEEALSLINKALSYDDRFFNVWNRKAIILQDLRRYEESKESFDRAIAIHSNTRVVENKAIMLRIWANELYFNSKDLSKAEMLVNEAISEVSNLSTTEIDIENYKNFAKDIRDRIEAIKHSQKSKEFNYLKNTLSNDVIRELTRDGHTLESQIYCLSRFIDDLEREMDCIFNRVYYSTKGVSGCQPGSGCVSGILVECYRNRGFINTKIISEFYPGQDHVDCFQMIVETIDENDLFSKDELSKLRPAMESSGYEYAGIIIMSDKLLIKFTKNNFLQREFKYSFKNNKITSSREFIDVDTCYRSSKCPESKIIENELTRIKNEYGYSLEHIEPPETMYFKSDYGNHQIFKYNFITKKIEKIDKKDLSIKELIGEKIPKEELICITTYHDAIKKFEKGMKFKLVKEYMNRDENNIALYLDGEKIGYVARYFCPDEVSRSDEINLSDNAYAEYLIYYYNSGYFYHIAKITDE